MTGWATDGAGQMTDMRPRIVALGGNATAGGSAEQLLRHALARCEARGADSLLLAGDAALPASMPVARTFADLPLDRLALRSVGCASRSEAAGDVIARGGRWQLRLLAPGEALPQAKDHDERWRTLQPNETLARQYRLDASLAAPADPTIQPIVDSIDTQRWFDDLSQLATWDRSSYGTTELFAARDWIGDQFGARLVPARTVPFRVLRGQRRRCAQHLAGGQRDRGQANESRHAGHSAYWLLIRR